MSLPPTRLTGFGAAPDGHGVIKMLSPRASNTVNTAVRNDDDYTYDYDTTVTHKDAGNSVRGDGGGGLAPRMSATGLFGYIGSGLSKRATSSGPGISPKVQPPRLSFLGVNSNADGLEGDAWDRLKRKSMAGDGGFGGAPLIGPNSSRRRSSNRQSMMKSNILAMEESFVPSWKRNIVDVIDGTRGTIFMAVITLWALFGDDIRLLGFYEEHDYAFVVVVYVILVLFSLEMILASVAKKGYLNGFYFWLDAVATLSLLMDIPPLMEAIGFSACVHDNYGMEPSCAPQAPNTKTRIPEP